MTLMHWLRGLAVAGAWVLAVSPAAAVDLDRPWPEVEGLHGEAVSFPSSSPFSPAQTADPAASEPATALGRLFLPTGDRPPRSVPAVVLLHGSGGVLSARELTYGAQLARMGVAALVVDAFAARRDMATGFTARLLSITETMLVADAYAGLRYLASLPMVDEKRVALVGFSYGAMATMYAMNADIARNLAPEGLRFVAHAAYYGPCIASFDNPRTTGAPLLMMWGDGDELIDGNRCQAFAGDLRSGGSRVDTVVYEGALHQWDGAWGRRRIGRLLGACEFRVEADGRVRDANTGMVMGGPITRRIILALCVEDRPYLIGRDDEVRAKSNRALGAFLSRAFRTVPQQG